MSNNNDSHCNGTDKQMSVMEAFVILTWTNGKRDELNKELEKLVKKIRDLEAQRTQAKAIIDKYLADAEKLLAGQRG